MNPPPHPPDRNLRDEARSFLPIEQADLVRLLAIAHRDRAQFFARHPGWAELYADRLLCIALCQGAARHFLDGTTGIKDFDLFAFYARHPARRWPARRRAIYDFGDPRFGQTADAPYFTGRRVDCMGRSLDAAPGDDPVAVLRRYLQEPPTTTARLLAQKAVILLEPVCGRVIWPVGSDSKNDPADA